MMLMICYDLLWSICLCFVMICYMLMFCYDLLYDYDMLYAYEWSLIA
jgi:hypothetical protein